MVGNVRVGSAIVGRANVGQLKVGQAGAAAACPTTRAAATWYCVRTIVRDGSGSIGHLQAGIQGARTAATILYIHPSSRPTGPGGEQQHGPCEPRSRFGSIAESLGSVRLSCIAAVSRRSAIKLWRRRRGGGLMVVSEVGAKVACQVALS